MMPSSSLVTRSGTRSPAATRPRSGRFWPGGRLELDRPPAGREAGAAEELTVRPPADDHRSTTERTDLADRLRGRRCRAARLHAAGQRVGRPAAAAPTRWTLELNRLRRRPP